MPPFMLGSARYLIAAPLLLGAGLVLRLQMWPTWPEMGRLAIIGVLMLGCGNTAVIWAEQYIPIGLAALLVASIPLYAALIEAILPQGDEVFVQAGYIRVFQDVRGKVQIGGRLRHDPAGPRPAE